MVKKKEFRKDFFNKIREEATSENNEFDPKTCVKLSENDILAPKKEETIKSQKETDWVLFKERKPKECKYYLLTIIEEGETKRVIALDEWVKLLSGNYRWDFYDDEEVIAWKNIPEVYKGEKWENT